MASNSTQSAANHERWSPMFHFVAMPILMANLVVALITLFKSPALGTAFVAAVAFAILVIGSLARMYALRVQDRLIRLEERLRMQRILPTEMQGRVAEFSVAQLVALRFASDAELADLSKAVLEDSITDQKAIKQRIKNWRPDFFRV